MNGFRSLNFQPIDLRITNLRFDRSIVNFAAVAILNHDLSLNFHITNEMLFNCTRHDLNNIVLKLEEKMLELRSNEIKSYDHCVGISTFFARLVNPTTDLTYNKIN